MRAIKKLRDKRMHPTTQNSEIKGGGGLEFNSQDKMVNAISAVYKNHLLIIISGHNLKCHYRHILWNLYQLKCCVARLLTLREVYSYKLYFNHTAVIVTNICHLFICMKLLHF